MAKDKNDKAEPEQEQEQEQAQPEEKPYEVHYPQPDPVPEIGETGDADDALAEGGGTEG